MAVSCFMKTRTVVGFWASRTKPHGLEQGLKQKSFFMVLEVKVQAQGVLGGFLSALSLWPVRGFHHYGLSTCDPVPTSFTYRPCQSHNRAHPNDLT